MGLLWINLLVSRRRYLWRQHCFHCRCARCEAPDLAGAPQAPRAAVEWWRRLERRVGNLLKPELEGESVLEEIGISQHDI